MQTYIVRQPILDFEGGTVGYEILYQDDTSALYNQKDVRVANAIEDFLLQLNTDTFLGGKKIFLTFTSNLIIKNIPKIFSPESLIIQIEDTALTHPLAQKIIYRFKKQGYTLAVQNFEFLPRYFGVLDIIDIIKIDFARTPEVTIKNIISLCRNFKKEIIAFNIDNAYLYDLAKELGCNYMQGTAVAEQSFSKVNRVSHIPSNFIHLMIEITKDEPDIEEISNIISRDVTLTYSLIKLVNSSYFALRSKARSVKQALVILGLGQLKKWVYLLSFKQNQDVVPVELIKVSFIRATYCAELLGYAQDIDISKSEAYLMGMFSTLGILMNAPIEEALNELSICDDIKNALISGEGRCGLLYKLIMAYENADWQGITNYSASLGIPIDILTRKYFESVESVNEIWAQLVTFSEFEDVDFEKEHELVKK